MKKIFSRALAVSVIALMPAGASLADPGLNDVPAHQHYILTPNGDRRPIGPDICDDPDLQQAFNQFHYNIHHSGIRVNGVFVPIETLGPQDGAPGLHDGQGAELRLSGC